MDAYAGMKISELVGVYNSLNPAKPLKGFKGKKDKLIEKIEALRASLGVYELAEDVVEKNASGEAALWEQAEEAPVDRVAPADGAIDEAGTEVLEETPVVIDSGLGSVTEPGTDDTEDEAAEATPAVRKSPGKSPRTIVAASMDLLCRVDYYENRDQESGPDNRVPKGHPKARSVGLTYSAIVDMIREEFPGCETSPACLRWYAVKMRVGERGYENHALPQRRPRSKPRKK